MALGTPPNTHDDAFVRQWTTDKNCLLSLQSCSTASVRQGSKYASKTRNCDTTENQDELKCQKQKH